MSDEAQSDFKTAVHEAGHAVFCYYHSIPFESVTLVPQDRPNGIRCGRCIVVSPRRAAEEIEVLLAGGEAERLYTGDAPGFSVAEDMITAVWLTENVLGLTLEELPAYLNKRRLEVNRFLSEQWPDVLVVARLLSSLKTVTYSQVQAAIVAEE